MDYNSLTAQIQQYAKRTDAFFIDEIPNFINQAIARIYNESKSLGYQATVQTNLIMDNNVLAKPANWYKTISFTIIDDRPPLDINPLASLLLLRSYEFCQSYWPHFTQTDTPKFYADIGYDQFYISPTPDYAYTVELIYSTLPLFNALNPQNFLTTRYPDLLLYACMLETAPFLKDDDRIPKWEALYDRALKGINLDFDKSFSDRSSTRDVS